MFAARVTVTLSLCMAVLEFSPPLLVFLGCGAATVGSAMLLCPLSEELQPLTPHPA
jgi:hypothetical protein